MGAEIRNKSPGDFDRNPSGLITDGLARIPSSLSPAYQFWNVRRSLIFSSDSRGFLFLGVFTNLISLFVFICFSYRVYFVIISFNSSSFFFYKLCTFIFLDLKIIYLTGVIFVREFIYKNRNEFGLTSLELLLNYSML